MYFHGLVVHILLEMCNPLCGCMTIYLFSYQRTSCLLPSFGNYKGAISNRAEFCVGMFSSPLGKYQGAQLLDLYGRGMFSFVRNCQYYSH